MNREWLRGKRVVIVGASDGIGKHLAFNLILRYNCYVIAISNNKKEMEIFYEKMQEYCDNLEYHIFDARKEKEWELFSQGLWQSDSKIDILINCVGELPKISNFEDFTQKDVENSMTTNFYSSVFSIRYLLPILKLSKSPSIINISCMASIMSIGGTSVYSAGKSALKSYTEVLAQELDNRFYVSLVLLGIVKGNFYRNQNEDIKKEILKYAISPNTAAKKIINAMSRKHSRIVVGRGALISDYIFRFFPAKAPKLLKAWRKRISKKR